MFETIRNRLNDWYSERNDREQLLLKVAAAVLPIVGLAFVGVLHSQSLQTIRNDIETYEETLDLLGDVAPKYRGKNAASNEEKQTEKFSREALENNDLKLTSFVATHATAVGIQVDSYDEGERRLGSGEDGEGPAVNKLQVDVEIRSAPVDKVMQLLERIEKADEPVVIERMTLSKQNSDKGTVGATIVVTTFERTAEG